MNWAYIAGFFDGEGSLCQMTLHGKNVGWRWQLAQNNKPVLDAISEFLIAYGIKSYIATWKDTISGNQAWSLRVDSRIDIYKIVLHLRGFSIVKQENIRLFFEWFNNPARTLIPIRFCSGLSRYYLGLHALGLSRKTIATTTGENEGRIRELFQSAKEGKIPICMGSLWGT